MKERIRNFCKAQPVLVISFLVALVTVFIVPPDKEYWGYCNKTVLIELFALMLAVAGLRSVGIFDNMTNFLLKKAGTVRRLGQILILMCFFSAMLVTNDVALLTFVPLTLLMYESIPDEKSRIMTIVLETVSANMGSMLTPVGNPQNLYLYNTYHLTAGAFLKTMLPCGILSLICVLLLTCLLPSETCRPSETESVAIDKKTATAYGLLFGFCLLTVFQKVPDWSCLVVAVVVALLFNRKLLLEVDYALLATFLCFFVFVGNIARVEAVRQFFSAILTGRELLISALLSQIISNVPAAVMLSGFTENGTALLLGVNVGGLGTLIASLASLISYQIYRKSEGAKPMQYMLIFSVVGFGMLALLLAFATFLKF
ncbi:MAG TPA: citrate transporter [Ruminococcus sp.]|nr:citrate transporter [Ruminococcus sp.]